MKKKLKLIITILISVDFLIIALLSSVDIAVYHIPGFYQKQFNANEVYNDLNRAIPKQEVNRAFDEMLLYLRGDRNDLDIKVISNGKTSQFYTNREKLHIADVRNLFISAYYLRRVLFVIGCLLATMLIAFSNCANEFIKDFSKISHHTILVANTMLLLLIAVISINFDAAFTTFHELLFNNDYWLLDPNKDDLINLLPESFFIHISIVIVMIYLSLVALGLMVIYLIQKSSKPRH